MARLELIAELKGNTLASCGGDQTVRLWVCSSPDDPSQWTCVNVLEGTHKQTIRSVAWSRNSRQLATASFDATTGIWERDADGGDYECVATLEGHENETKSVAWSSSGALVATCGRDKSVWIWEVVSDSEFECLSVLQEHTQDVKMVVWHPTEDLLASASYDDTIKIWREDDDDWYCSDTLEGHRSTVWAIDFDKSGDNLVSASDDKTLKFWRCYRSDNPENVSSVTSFSEPKWKCVCTLSGYHRRCIYSVSWSKVNDRVASAGGDNIIRVFERDEEAEESVESGDSMPIYKLIASVDNAHSVSDVNCVQWSPVEKFGALLASTGDDGIVKIWKFVE
ncbi:7033_t:CDS:2 [Paraglomus brasilianum]|uniref:Probable cytosolic iron-sulfur protein assembly protein 1 n=1 Tax=Paraglomus brasilianum TaxID=144538 RepID=A0A9N9ACQ5_9GLOM|nr:7033_t:CDS:2 [Paraglomus brasilianum]